MSASVYSDAICLPKPQMLTFIKSILLEGTVWSETPFFLVLSFCFSSYKKNVLHVFFLFQREMKYLFYQWYIPAASLRSAFNVQLLQYRSVTVCTWNNVCLLKCLRKHLWNESSAGSEVCVEFNWFGCSRSDKSVIDFEVHEVISKTKFQRLLEYWKVIHDSLFVKSVQTNIIF